MYVIDINDNEVFIDVEFGPDMGVEKVEVITGFSPDDGYIKEIAPDWLKDMIQDPNLLYWDIVVQNEPTITVTPDPETWACLPLDSE